MIELQSRQRVSKGTYCIIVVNCSRWVRVVLSSFMSERASVHDRDSHSPVELMPTNKQDERASKIHGIHQASCIAVVVLVVVVEILRHAVTRTMQVDWELSQSFVSDGQGVRAACVLPAAPGGADSFRVVTGNQIGGLCEFGVPSGHMNLISFQHDHAVTALLASTDCYVTGCKDAVLRIFDQEHNLIGTLQGHDKPVTSLAWCGEPGQYLISGSWDGTAKVWNFAQRSLIATLPDHENSVSVTGLSRSGHMLNIATGSAGVAQNNIILGHTVRIWQVDTKTGEFKKLKSVANDHEGPIRDVCLFDPNTLASCSNDGTVKLRSTETGTCTATLSFIQQTQHPPMLLSVTAIEHSVLASAEDGHVVVWNMGQDTQPQIIMHAQCVWNVVSLPNGDFCTCCQDGTFRIFTRATERIAPQAERDEFAKQVQEALQKQKSGPTSEEVSKLPRWENNLEKRGTSDGQVQLFQKDGIAIAAQWSAASQTWIEVGQVMGTSEDTGTIDGVKYDHVLPVEIDQTDGGVAKLQIGYNNGENPFVAAQRFVDSHQLPQYHLAQIADYIQQRVGNQAPTIGMGGSGPVATTGVPIASYQYLPITGYKSFRLSEKTAATTLEKMKTKIQEFGKLTETEMSKLTNLMETIGASNRYHASKVDDSELAVVTGMLEKFPPNEAFPALDLARLAVLHPDAASKSRFAYWDKVLLQALGLCRTTDNLEGPAAVAIPMLSLRLFANAFKGGPGSLEAVSDYVDPMLTCTEAYVKSSNKNIRLSVATVLHNVCHFLNSKSQGSRFAHKIVPMLNEIMTLKTYETEALMRSMQALGTLVMSCTEAKDAAKTLYLASKVEPAASPHTSEVKAAAKEVYTVLA